MSHIAKYPLNPNVRIRLRRIITETIFWCALKFALVFLCTRLFNVEDYIFNSEQIIPSTK
jgi:hypothetical protein